MIKLELNEIPGYTLDDSGFVTLVFKNGFAYFTGFNLKQLGFKDEEEKPVEVIATVEAGPAFEQGNISENALLSVIAMITNKAEIPR